MKKLVYIIGVIIVFTGFVSAGVHINEVYYKIPDQSGWNKNDQWIEIFNFSSSQITLDGWKLKDDQGSVFSFSVTLSSNQRLVLVADSSRFIAHWDSILNPGILIIEYGGFIDINKDIGMVCLLNNGGSEISRVEWGGTGTSTGVPAGYSLGLYPDGNVSPQPYDYVTCRPTPGEENREAPASAVNPATWGRIKAMFSAER